MMVPSLNSEWGGEIQNPRRGEAGGGGSRRKQAHGGLGAHI